MSLLATTGHPLEHTSTSRARAGPPPPHDARSRTPPRPSVAT